MITIEKPIIIPIQTKIASHLLFFFLVFSVFNLSHCPSCTAYSTPKLAVRKREILVIFDDVDIFTNLSRTREAKTKLIAFEDRLVSKHHNFYDQRYILFTDSSQYLLLLKNEIFIFDVKLC